MEMLLSFILTLIIIFVIPIIVYGIFVSLFGLKEPEKKLRFFVGVLIEKVGTSAGFVALFYLGKDSFIDSWLIYSLVWVAMYAITEIGQVYMTDSSKKEAAAGIISEAIYFPLAAFVISLLVK